MTKLPEKPLILWDIDGTMIRSNGAGARSFFQAFKQVYRLSSLNTDVSFAGGVDRAIFNELCRINRLEIHQSVWDEFIGIYISFLLKEAADLSNWELLPGVKALLESCRNRYCFGLLTGNIRQGAFIKLKIFDLDPYFHTGGFGDEITDRTQLSRVALDNCMAHFGITFNPEQITIIGDTTKDIECARELQCTCYVVTTGYIPYEVLAESKPDKIVNNLMELYEIL